MGKRNGSNRQFIDSATLNNRTYFHYFDRLKELSCSMFEWINLPETVDPRYLEMSLFEKGKVLFFEDDVLGFLALPVAAGGKLNVYGIPTGRRAYATNGYNARRTEKDSVIIFNNYLKKASVGDVELFAQRLYNCDRISDVNIRAQKTPILVIGTEEQQLTLKNLYMKYEGNEPVIFGDKFMDTNALRVLSTNAPFVADKIRAEKDAIWNEALTYLGISNINIVKKERMITDEVTRNQGGTIASRHTRLEMRREACNQINKMFNLDIWCDYREDYRETDDEFMLPGETETQKPATPMVTDMRTRGGYSE